MRRLETIGLFLTGLLFACVILGVLAYLPESRIRDTFDQILTTFNTSARAVIATAAVVIIVGLVAGLVAGLGIGWSYLQRAGYATTMARLRTDEYKIQIQRQRFVIETAPAGAQAWKLDVLENLTDPLHLAIARLNGAPENETREERLARWASYNVLHATAKPAQLAAGQAAPELPQVIRPVLPILTEAQRAIIAGPSGTGKTTLLQWLVAERAMRSKIILIDPHGQRPKYGSLVEAIGCGMKWDEVAEGLRRLDYLMYLRYQEIAAGAAHRSHSNVLVLIDEWMAVCDQLDESKQIIRRLATQARKASIDVFLVAHSLRVEPLGIKGAGDLLGNFTVVELHKDLDNRRSCYLHYQEPGQKMTKVECTLPGPFDESRAIRPEHILELPPAPTLEQIKIIDVLRRDPAASDYAICKQVFNGKQGSSYKAKIEEVKALFGPF